MWIDSGWVAAEVYVASEGGKGAVGHRVGRGMWQWTGSSQLYENSTQKSHSGAGSSTREKTDKNPILGMRSGGGNHYLGAEGA